MIRVAGIGGWPQRASSALRKARSNSALWAISGASPMKAIEFGGDRGEERLVGEEPVVEAVHPGRLDRHRPLGIEVAVEGLAGRDVVEQLDAADLDDPVAVGRVEAGGFGVEDDLAHIRES